MSVELMKLPDSMFSDVVKQKEVLTVQLLNREDRKGLKANNPNYDGFSDVRILNGENANSLITREYLLSNFTNVNGKKIKLAGWHYHKPYTVVRITKELKKVLRIPKRSKHAITINGRDVPKPCLIVCNVVNNQIDKRNPRVLTNPEEIKAFRKMHKVMRLADVVKARTEAHERKMISQIQVQRQEALNRKTWSPRTQQVQQDELLKAPYEVVGRALNMQNVLIGFMVRDKKSGKIEVCQLGYVQRMCIEKKISNLTIASRQETGKTYFRGVGIKIENLPSKQYNTR